MNSLPIPIARRQLAPLIGAALTLLPLAVNAQAQTVATADAARPSLLPTALVLFLVLALIPVALWLLKRAGAGGTTQHGGMRVVSQLALGPRERLIVVEAGERWLVLGVTAASINRVGTLPKGALPENSPPLPFAQLLKHARRHNNP